MSGINLARNYGEVQGLVKANQNSLFEVNTDGSIRTQNIKEKLANIGSRLLGKFEARRAEKDARVKDAINLLFSKTGQSVNSYAAPQKDRLLDRFYNPVAFTSRKTTLKDHKSTTRSVFVQANQDKFQPNLGVKAQKVLYQSLAHSLAALADQPKYREESNQIRNLIGTLNYHSNRLDANNAAQNLQQLKEDLKPLGLVFGAGDLINYDLSKGLVEWVKNAAPDELDRVS